MVDQKGTIMMKIIGSGIEDMDVMVMCDVKVMMFDVRVMMYDVMVQ